MSAPDSRSETLPTSEAGGSDYEPFGDEWRREVMKLTKAQIVDVLRDVARNRSVELGQPPKWGAVKLTDAVAKPEP